jgi:ABC-type polysaccharide/polyol phosphate transport system ATPase subunit
VRKLCDAAVVLEEGTAQFYDDVDEAIFVHTRNMNKT